MTGVIQAAGPARVRIDVRQAPVRMTLNGNVVTADYDPADAMVSLAVPAGSNAIAISWAGDR
jgi:hypothetical protein